MGVLLLGAREQVLLAALEAVRCLAALASFFSSALARCPHRTLPLISLAISSVLASVGRDLNLKTSILLLFWLDLQARVVISMSSLRS